MADQLRLGNQATWPHSSGQMNFPRSFGLAATPYSGSLTSSHRPVSFLGRSNSQQDEANKYYMYFGFNSRLLEKPAEFDYDREMQNLPEAYRGNNPYIAKIIITQITKEEQWVIREALPLVKWEGGTRIDWERWIFNDHRLNRRPEQAVSRMVTSRRDTRSETLTSYGIAGILEHGFMNTPKGQLAYAANLMQFINATLETMIHGGQLALLSVDYSQHLHQQIQTPLPGNADVRLLMERELRNTALLQKTDNGVMLLVKDFQETFMRRMGKRPNYLILGHGGEQYAANRHGLFVPSQNQPVKDRAIRDSSLVVREWRPIKATEDVKDDDPGLMRIYLGRMFKMNLKFIRGKVKPEHYTTGLMSRKVQNCIRHEYDIVQYPDYLRRTGLYAPTGADAYTPLHRPRNERFFGGALLVQQRAKEVEIQSRWRITSLGEAFMEGCENWHDYMSDHGVLRPWIASLLARSPVVQNAFLYDVCRYSRRNDADDGNGGLFFGDNDQDWDQWISAVHRNAPPPLPGNAVAAAGGGVANALLNAAAALGLGPGLQQPQGSSGNKEIIREMLKMDAPNPARLFAGLLAVLSNAFSIDLDTYNNKDLTKAKQRFWNTDNRLYKPAADTAALLAQGLIQVDGTKQTLTYPVWTDGKSFTTVIRANGDQRADMLVTDDLKGLSPRATRIAAILRLIDEHKIVGDAIPPEAKDYSQAAPPDTSLHLEPFQVLLTTFTRAIPSSAGDVQTNLLQSAAEEALDAINIQKIPVKGRLMALEKEQRAKEAAQDPSADRKDGIVHALPSNLKRKMKDVLYEFDDSVRAIYSKHHAVFAQRPDRFARLMNWLYEVYREQAAVPANSARGSKQQMQAMAFEAMNLFLSELYLCNIKTADVLFSAANLQFLEDDSHKNWTKRLLQGDFARISRLRAKLGSAAHDILARLIPDSIAEFMEEIGPESSGLVGQRDSLRDMKTLQVPGDIKQVSEAAIVMALRSLSIREGDILFFSCEHDLWPLVCINAYAPSGEFDAWTAVALRAYGEAGNTVYGHQSLEMGDDPGAKVHTLHYTLHQKALISEPRWVEHRENVQVTRHYGGWDATQIWDPCSDEDREQWKQGNYQHKSYFSVPIYPDEVAAEQDNAHDMLGRLNPLLVQSSGGLCPIMGPVIGAFWGISHGTNPLNRLPWLNNRDAYSTICYEQHQLIPQPVGNGTMNPDGEVVVDAGHFGPDFGYPGSSHIFTGQRMYLERPNFHPASYRPVAAGYAPGVP